MRCAGITYTKSENTLAVHWQAICENWCQFTLCPREREFSCCTKIPQVVILTCSLKLCAQWFKLLLRILPFVSTKASWNLQSMQYYGILQVSSYKETPAAKAHSSHDPHSLHGVRRVTYYTNPSHRASTNAVLALQNACCENGPEVLQD